MTKPTQGKETLREAVAREMCVECIGTGYVEQIAFWGRPCDACRGEGYLIVPLTAFQQENSDG